MPPSDTDEAPEAFPPNALAQEWFVKAIEILSVDIGPEFASLKKKWILLEGTNGYKPTRQRLIARSLSAPFQDLFSVEADIDLAQHSANRVSNQFREWWSNIQPSAWKNVHEMEQLLPITDKDLATVKKFGKGGWVSVLVYLRRWEGIIQMSADEDRQQLREDWDETVRDVVRVVDLLLRCIKAIQ